MTKQTPNDKQVHQGSPASGDDAETPRVKPTVPPAETSTVTPAETQAAVAEAATEAASKVLEERAPEQSPAPPARGRKRGADPLVGEVRHQLLPLLVLHFINEGPSYGNQLIERVAELTAGVVSVNPNTMYPLLRDLEGRGLIEGQWEHPERRTRRFYTATPAGQSELASLRDQAGERLAALETSVRQIRAALFDSE